MPTINKQVQGIMIIFRIPQIQRAIATLVLCTFGSGIVTPMVAAAQTTNPSAKTGGAPAPTPTTLIPLKGATSSGSGNNVLLPVGPRGLPGSQASTAVAAAMSDPAAAFAAAIASLHELAEQANLKPASGKQSAATLLAAVNALRAQYKTVVAQQQQMNLAFTATQTFLAKQGLPSTILQRHQAMVTTFNANLAQLKQTMSALDNVAAGKGDAQTALTQLLQFVQQYPSESGQGASSTALSWGESKGSGKTKGKSEIRARLDNRIEQKAAATGAVGTLSGIALPATSLSGAPVAADLAATDDVQITPAITALAASLHNNPVAIYEYVRNNIQYQVGYGSLRGAAQTLQAQSGNDIDTASLLIALYRAAGTPARYAYGTIQVPVARVQTWLQVDNPAAAQSLLTQAGVPNAAITTAGQISAIELEHVWVQAYVDASPSGGARNLNPSTWVALDASFKQDQQHAGLPIAGAVSFNQAGLFDAAAQGAVCTSDYAAGLNQANIQSGYSAYQTQLNQLLGAQGPDLTVGGVLGSSTITVENNEILLGSLPYQTVAQSAVFDALPANLQGAVHLQLYANAAAQAQGNPVVAYSISNASLAGKRLTLSFAPATAADAATLAAYLPKAHSDGSAVQASEFPASIPGYLINVTANIMLDGQVVASGGSFVLGSQLIGNIGSYNAAAGAWNDSTFTPYAGDYHAIVSDSQGINAAQITAVQTRLAATAAQLSNKTNTLTADAVTGDLLNQTVLAWFATVDANSAVFQRAADVIEQRLPSIGRAVAPVQPHLALGIVTSVSFPGVSLNIDSLQSAVASQSQGINLIAYTRQANQRNAAYAHLILEQHYSAPGAPGGATPAVSAVKLLAQAAVQTGPASSANKVYTLNTANLAQDLPNISLSAAQTTDVQNAVGAGLNVSIAQSAATIGNWTGQGMLEDDPVTGSGLYRISGSAGTADANVSATAALYPTQGMGWLALASPSQAAASVTPSLSAAANIDSSLNGILSGSSGNNGSSGNGSNTVRWSYYTGQADVANGLFLAGLAGAASTVNTSSPTPCQNLTSILAANLGTSTGISNSGSGAGTGGSSGNISIPVITSSPVTAGTAAQAYQYPVAASDPAGTALTFSLPSAPGGMSISSSGVISWPNPVAGIVTITVRADNGKAYAQQSYQLTIGTQPLPLSVSVAVAPAVINAGQSTTITVAANGGTGPITNKLSIDGLSVTLIPGTSGTAANTASATITGTKVGAHQITASATDSKNTASQTTVYSVADPSDTGSPVAQITSPNLDATLTNATPVIGSASDQNLAYYQLLVAPAGVVGTNGGANSWTEIARGYNNVTNGTLGTFDPTTLPNGIYQLNLNVVNVNGVQTSNLITVEVNSHLKIGQFSLSFQDLNINASGIPIQITRTYDTRRKAQNLDFGQGWSIDYQNVQINKNIQLGLSWTVVSNTLALTQCIQPGQAHKIDIILPTGELARFTASNSPQCALSNVPEVNIQFTPLPGTTSSLAIENVPQGLEFQGGIIFDQSGDSGTSSWNPQNYALTTADNYVYHLTEGIGITSVTDPNGNTLTYGQNGILHSNGTGVAFQRDANGHITAITDPSGKQINYSYSATGDLIAVNDRNNATSTMTYDQSHGLASYTDPNGNLTARYVYDSTGKLIAAYDANGNAIQTQHNPNQDVVTDQRGNKTTYTYDNNGNITQITNALGQTTTYTYDANGNQASVTDPAGNTTLTTYDPQSYLQTSETDPLGHTTSSAYDKVTHARLMSATDANGNPTTYIYGATGSTYINQPLGSNTNVLIDGAGNTSQLNVAGQITSYGYDAKGNKTSETDAAGNTINYSYDANGNQLSQSWTANGNGQPQIVTSTQAFDGNGHVVSQADALGNTTKTQYTAGGQVSTVTDAQGRITSYQYDPVSGKLASTTYPDGTSESIAYDASRNKVATTDRQGRTTQYQYDALNRLIKTVLPDGTSTGTSYDAAGRVATTTDAKGNVTTNGYDAAGNLITVTDALGKQTQYAYDANGNQTKVTDPLGNVTQYQYDALNRVVQVTYPDGKSTATAWRTDGRKQSDTDQNGSVTSYGYDADGRLNQVNQTNAATQLQTVYGYDTNGNKVSQTDANGNVTKWTFDVNNRMTSRTLPAGQQETYKYDINGNQTVHTDFIGNGTSFAYDNLNQLLQIKRPDGVTVVTTYTSNSQVASVTASPATTGNPVQAGQTIYAYDANDRLTKQTNPDGSFIAYAYDANGNVTQVSTAQGTVNLVYDTDQRLTSVTDVTGKTTVYTYDAAGRKSTITNPAGVTASFAYDNNGRILQMLYAHSGSVVGGSVYTLAPNGQRTQVQQFDDQSTVTNNIPSNPARSTVYSYDGVNRLTQEALTDRAGNTSTIAYQYDKVGNRAQKTITTSAGTKTVAYAYDANDRLTQETDTVGTTLTQTNYTWDSNGNMTSKMVGSQITVYQWDSQNRLIEVDQGASQAAAIPVALFTYDAGGNRVKKVDPQSGKVTLYRHDSNQANALLVEEDVTQGGVTTVATYTWGNGGQLIGMNVGGQQRYAATDAQGSVMALTDVAGHITDTWAYDAFGNQNNRTGATVNPIRYTGEYFDDAVALQYNRARWYDASIGRFNSIDPINGTATLPLTLNKYIYANSSPVNGLDPSGLENLPGLQTAEVGEADIETTSVENVEEEVASNAESFLCRSLSLASEGMTRPLHHFYPKALGGKVPYPGNTVAMDYWIHRLFHDVLDDALILSGLMPQNAGRAEFEKAFTNNPAAKKAGQAALLASAKYVDGLCSRVPGYRPLTKLIEDVIQNDRTDF